MHLTFTDLFCFLAQDADPDPDVADLDLDEVEDGDNGVGGSRRRLK